ncbi:hypothetical protein [Flavobacterium terrigena]|uniref:Uncharacterized protein n=1 Tax=Flavobacterium terrigena TaxID=402734 RepID=A0A1H6S2U9_9FLAO|nr:hypothetical protein [Flavobacterium terrigena]SEI62219.1 hypothetical protein SAMN05660918_1182 [Flavobacterium terrigena]
MIIDEIIEIIENSRTENILGRKLNNLYDEFRSGRDSNDILKLLTHSNDSLVWHGCSICCEVIVENSKNRNTLINELYNILKKSKSSKNRERAFSALYGFYMDVKDIGGFNKICNEFSEDDLNEIGSFAKNFLKDSNFKRH